MKLIKIINGTYGFRPQPHVVERKNANDAPFEVNDEEAERLVRLGVAAIAFGEDSETLQDAMNGVVDQLEDQPAPPDDEPEDGAPEDPDDEPEPVDEPEDPATDPEPAQKFDPDELAKLTNPELAEIAHELGVEVKHRPKKSELIDLRMKAAAEDDELPDLGAAEPEV